MKKFKFILMGCLAALGIASFSACQKDNTPSQKDDTPSQEDDTPSENVNPVERQPAKYTIMLYGCGGGDVDHMLEQSLLPMMEAMAVQDSKVCVTVMYSMSKDGSKFKENGIVLGEAATTYRYELSTTEMDWDNYKTKYKFKAASEVELYKASTLQEYIEWAKKTAPAENYILVPMNHGGGYSVSKDVLTKGIVYDDNHDDKSISAISIAEAINLSKTNFKAILWYGCMMGMLENLTEVAPYCEYQIASSHVSRVHPFTVARLISAINANPDDFENALLAYKATFEKLFTALYANVKNDDGNGTHGENCDWSAWRSNKLSGINQQVKALGEYLVNNYNEKEEVINSCTAYTYIYDKGDYSADLMYYSGLLCANEPELENISTELNKAISDARVFNISGNYHKLDEKYVFPEGGAFSLGVSLYSIVDPDFKANKDQYNATAFDKATGWGKWLEVNKISVKNSQTNPSNYFVSTPWDDNE